MRGSASSCGTDTSTWMRLRCGRAASIRWNQTAGPWPNRVDQPVPGSGPAGLVGVAQHGLSERPDGGVKRVAPDLEYLHRPVALTDPDGRVQPELGGHGGDALG